MNNIISFMQESNTARFFIPVGLMLTIFGVIVLFINLSNQNYIKVDSYVIKTEIYEDAYTDIDGNYIEATYKAYIKYTVDNKEYNSELVGVSNYKTGEKVTIYYNPENPSQITQTKSIVFPTILIFAGIASLTCGIISARNILKKNKKTKSQENVLANIQ